MGLVSAATSGDRSSPQPGIPSTPSISTTAVWRRPPLRTGLVSSTWTARGRHGRIQRCGPTGVTLDAFEVDQVLFQYSRAAKELWKFFNIGDIELTAGQLHNAPRID